MLDILLFVSSKMIRTMGPNNNGNFHQSCFILRIQVLPRKPLEPLNFDDLANIQNNSPARTTKNLLKPIIFNNGCENVEENHSDLSLCEMSDQFPELTDDFEIKRRKYVGRSHSAPTVQRVRIAIVFMVRNSILHPCLKHFYAGLPKLFKIFQILALQNILDATQLLFSFLLIT